MIPLLVISLFVLLFLSAIFSGSETSYFSISEIERRRLLLSDNRRRYLAGRLLENPGKLLVTILTGNMIVNIALSTINAELFEHFWGHSFFVVILEIYLTTFILLLLGEITPKTIAVQRTEAFAELSSYIIKIFEILVFPLRLVLEKITSIFLPAKNSRTVDEAEIKSAIEASSRSGFIPKKIGILSDIILGLDQISLSEFAVNIADIMIVEKSNKTKLDSYFCDGYKAVVFYNEGENNITEVYTLNDYLSGDYDGSFYLIPDSTSVIKGLSILIENAADDLLLVDEHGRITGVVPDEELLSTLCTGSFNADPIFKMMGESVILAGSTSLKLLCKKFNRELNASYAKSIGGFICEISGSIPKPGDVIEHDNLQFRILKSSEKNVDLLSIKSIDSRQQ